MAAALLIVAALPAMATPQDGDGEHKVPICHVTNDESNPWVIVYVDFAAFGDSDHAQHQSKDNRVDEMAVDGMCPDNGGGTLPPPPTEA